MGPGAAAHSSESSESRLLPAAAGGVHSRSADGGLGGRRRIRAPGTEDDRDGPGSGPPADSEAVPPRPAAATADDAVTEARHRDGGSAGWARRGCRQPHPFIEARPEGKRLQCHGLYQPRCNGFK